MSFVWQKKALPQIVVRILGNEAKAIKYAGWGSVIDQIFVAPYAIGMTFWLNWKVGKKLESEA